MNVDDCLCMFCIMPLSMFFLVRERGAGNPGDFDYVFLPQREKADSEIAARSRIFDICRSGSCKAEAVKAERIKSLGPGAHSINYGGTSVRCFVEKSNTIRAVKRLKINHRSLFLSGSVLQCLTLHNILFILKHRF